MIQKNLLSILLCTSLSVLSGYWKSYEFPISNDISKKTKSRLNQDVKTERAIFLNNSMTEGWVNKRPQFFEKNNLIDGVHPTIEGYIEMEDIIMKAINDEL